MRLLLCVLLAGIAVGASAPEVRAVYLLPMSGGLDQYLANRLISAGVYRVVTDPKLADAIFTDQIGAGFEQKLTDLYAQPEPEDTDKADKNSKPVTHVSNFGRGKGTIFLVDLKSRAIIWSGYERPGKVTPNDLNRTANRIVQQIKKVK